MQRVQYIVKTNTYYSMTWRHYYIKHLDGSNHIYQS